MKKRVILACLAVLTVLSMAACAAKGFDEDGNITVITRESGSGTRDAFTELFGIEEIIETADITEKTNVMITSVSQNANAIGYISLGSLNDTVKALKVDGAEATAENVKNGSYKISRPFNIAVKEGLSAVAQDFITFIMSSDGQKVIEEEGCVSVSSNGAYTKTAQSGKITIAGSSSVTPVMEKLKEAYNAINPDVTIEVTMSDSSSGMTSVAEGVCDIGMASRDLKDSELAKGLTPTKIAIDGIAVIVNNENTFDDISSAKVKDIYTGTAVKWSDIK